VFQKEERAMYELIVVDVTSDTPVGMGVQTFKDSPLRGDWIEVDEVNDRGAMFEVVRVAHSSTGDGSDLYVKRVGFTADAIKKLCGPKEITADMDPEEAARLYREMMGPDDQLQ